MRYNREHERYDLVVIGGGPPLHKGCPEDINDLAVTVARVGQMAVLEETFPPLACMEELGEEDELALTGNRSVWVKLRIETTTRSIYRPTWSGLRGGRKTLTLRVS